MGLGSIVFGVVWVESVVNEVIHEVQAFGDGDSFPNVSLLQTLIGAAEVDSTSASLGLKLRTVWACLNDSPVDEGRQPFQDFATLVRFRNTIIHQRPERIAVDTEPMGDGAKIMVRKGGIRGGLYAQYDQLAARGLVSTRDPKDLTPLVTLLNSAHAARWAFMTARAMVIEVVSWFPEEFQNRTILGTSGRLARALHLED